MITRRTTLKAIAAAVMAPTIHLRDTVPDERLLLAFCDPTEMRYDFSKPFGVGSLTYASDRMSLIRCELASRQEDGERRLPGNVIDVWNYHWHPGDWRPLTPDMLVPKETDRVTGLCPYCGDRRVSFGEHWPTDQVAADQLPDWDADDNTIRDISCVHCNGKEYTGPSCVRIGDVHHQVWPMRRILALPNPRVCATDETILFKADGFEGMSLGISEQ